MKIIQLIAEMLHADKRTDGYRCMTKLIFAFRNFVYALGSRWVDTPQKMKRWACEDFVSFRTFLSARWAKSSTFKLPAYSNTAVCLVSVSHKPHDVKPVSVFATEMPLAPAAIGQVTASQGVLWESMAFQVVTGSTQSFEVDLQRLQSFSSFQLELPTLMCYWDEKISCVHYS